MVLRKFVAGISQTSWTPHMELSPLWIIEPSSTTAGSVLRHRIAPPLPIGFCHLVPDDTMLLDKILRISTQFCQ